MNRIIKSFKGKKKLLSIYFMISLIGIALGSLLLNFSKPEKYEPFILISLLLSSALIPILLTKRKAPKFKKLGFLKNDIFTYNINDKTFYGFKSFIEKNNS